MRHLTGLRDVEAARLLALLEAARVFRAHRTTGQPPLELLKGRTIALLFHEASTRTRFSFEMACSGLGARTLAVSAPASSATKGETLLDTARVLRQIGADAVVVRHKTVGAPHQLARHLGLPIVSAGDGTNEHPTQGLLDLLTISDHFDDFGGLRVGIVGDVRHSRVARSAMHGLHTLGADVVVAGPGPLCTGALESLGVQRVPSLDHVVDTVQVLMMLRIQKERIGPSMMPSESEYRAWWGLTAARADRLQAGAIVMHPGPANRGVEIDDEVVDGPQSVIFDQMANGVPARMAALCDVLEVAS
jgi:aspartate carbamoyltransferase catalytic subunit